MTLHCNGEDHDCSTSLASLTESLIVGLGPSAPVRTMAGSVNDEENTLFHLNHVIDGHHFGGSRLEKKSKHTTSIRTQSRSTEHTQVP